MERLKLGIINLGLNEKEFNLFLEQVAKTQGSGWDAQVWQSSYKKINPNEVAVSCDALVLSPGNAKVGLLDHIRASEKDAQIGPLYNIIHSAVEEGIPLLGVNAGHEALNCAYGWAIDRIPDHEKGMYQYETRVYTDRIHKEILKQDPIAQGPEEFIDFIPTNNYVVLPREKQRKRWGQDKVTQLVDHMGYPLISKVESEAPVYGFQFNIQPGTEPIFRNFFVLAKQYLERKQG